MLLKGKVCLIAGVSSLRGIGYATAELFAAHGAQIVVANLSMDGDTARTIADAIEASTGTRPALRSVQCDISNAADCAALMATIQAEYGRLDALVNCVGIVASAGMLDITGEDFDRIINVNLKGAFNLCQSALRLMQDRGGTLVNVASVAAQRGGGIVGGAHYAASKGGMISLTRTIAREFGPRGIRANIVSPSMTDTGMLDDTIAPERYDEIVDSIPMRRAGLPKDIAGACLFLSCDLSAYMTGTTLDVNGGSHIH